MPAILSTESKTPTWLHLQYILKTCNKLDRDASRLTNLIRCFIAGHSVRVNRLLFTNYSAGKTSAVNRHKSQRSDARWRNNEISQSRTIPRVFSNDGKSISSGTRFHAARRFLGPPVPCAIPWLTRSVAAGCRHFLPFDALDARCLARHPNEVAACNTTHT